MGHKDTVVKVIDGDTFMTANRKCPIRLAGVTAPRKGRRGAAIARNALKEMIDGKTVSVVTVARSVYGFPIANVKVGRRSVNKAMKAVAGQATR